MPLTRDFKETVMELAQNPEFRVGLLTEAIECLMNGEPNVAKSLIRDYVNATIGFKELGILTDKKPHSLMRMLSSAGNPGLDNISAILSLLSKHEGVELHVQIAGKKKAPKKNLVPGKRVKRKAATRRKAG